MTDTADLIAGDELKAAALKYIGETRAKIEGEQKGLRSIFDSWLHARPHPTDQFRSQPHLGGQRTRADARVSLRKARTCNGILRRLRLFLDRWRQGRFVDFPSASDRAPIIIPVLAPNSAPTCCSPAKALRR